MRPSTRSHSASTLAGKKAQMRLLLDSSYGPLGDPRGLPDQDYSRVIALAHDVLIA